MHYYIISLFICLDEWIPIATKLSESGKYVTVLVYTHTLHKVPLSDLLSLLHEKVMTEVLQASRVVVMGKSAGGALAQQFALQHPSRVLALVLAAPSSSTPDHIAALCPPAAAAAAPLFLAWATDDPSFGKSKSWVDTCQGRKKDAFFSFYSADTGGHRVLPEYAAPIQSFLDSQHITM